MQSQEGTRKNGDKADSEREDDEWTPLLAPPTLSSTATTTKTTTKTGQQLWGELQAATYLSFSRRRPQTQRQSLVQGNDRYGGERQSLRLPLTNDSSWLFQQDHGVMEPVDALSPLAAAGVIVCTDGYCTTPRPPSTVKSLPAYAPFRRTERHRSFILWWINEFRHWWKSSRLLVRLAGLWTLATTMEFLVKMQTLEPFKAKHKATEKNVSRAVRLVKKLGRGGPMRFFLKTVQPFTRTLRILVGAWRWVEAAQCRRLEVGVEETLAFIGNRVSRILARSFVDILVIYIGMPIASLLFRNWLPQEAWNPILFLAFFGVLRACSPYMASFQGSRAGRVLTREFFKSLKLRWQPVMRVKNLNLESDDCCELDEVSENADLARVAKLVAKALGASQTIGVDGMAEQAAALAREGFQQVGAGSGGYAVYVCHRRVWTKDTSVEGEETPILLHITPHGPSILNVMPRYVVLEFETSVDRREKWSEFLSRKVYNGPPVVEGYCYQGAFFSPHHFAQLKTRYDKQLLAYDSACRAMCKPRTGRKPNPPTDHKSLKLFLADGKKPRKRRRNAREYRQLQKKVHALAQQLKAMKEKQTAPRGVILYFEGLDCSGKSSTGGLVQQALEEAGYRVRLCQYNRPPTPEQKKRPWMDRFEVPESSMVFATTPEGQEDLDNPDALAEKFQNYHDSLVWDRGPAGDFVYGELGKATDEVRAERFREFMAFDREMYEKKILFCKLLFVTTRDSIASTLGKRLAQRQMANDLRIWLQSSRGGDSVYGDIGFEGLDEITLHIDPTDFVAFNKYQKNLRIFANFALNTDSDENPWLVVNTTDRYAARSHLLRGFASQMHRFHARQQTPTCCPSIAKVSSSTGTPTPTPTPTQDMDTPGLTVEEVERGFVKPYPLSGLLALAGMLFLLFWYSEHTTFGKNIDSFATWMASTGNGGEAKTAVRLLEAMMVMA